MRVVAPTAVGHAGTEGGLHPFAIQLQGVTSVEANAVITVPTGGMLVGVARGEEVLAVGSREQAVISVLSLSIAAHLPSLVAVVNVVVKAGLPQRLPSVAGMRIERTAFARRAVVVQVVGIGIDADARMVAEAHGKETGEESPLQTSPRRGGSCSCLHIAEPSDGVFLLQLHIHDVVLVVLLVAAQPLGLLGEFVVDLHFLHGVGRQVVEHHGVVASEELLAVEQQALHELAIVVDLSVLLQFHARHLLDEGIEHGAFSKLEGIGIVDQRVATIVEHHLRSRHLHLLQGVALPLHVERRQLARVFTLVQVLQTEREIGGLIAHVADTQQIVLRQLWDGKQVEGVVATLLTLHPERAGLAGVEGGAVGGK